MKIIIKGGKGNSNRIVNFFLRYILPIMKEGIEIENSDRIPLFYKRSGDGPKFMPTAEVFVNLSADTIKHALIGANPIEINPSESRRHEFAAIKKIKELDPNFKVNFYSFVSLSSD